MYYLIIADDCGRSYFEANLNVSYIVNGANVVPHSYPFVVHVSGRGGICSGSLLTDKWVLTAAHCVQNSANVTVSLGKRYYFNYVERQMTSNITDPDMKPAFRNVRRFVIHPGYDGSMKEDIALLEMAESVKFNKKIQPICLPPKGFNVLMKKMIFSGWGLINTSNTPPVELQEAVVTPRWYQADTKLFYYKEEEMASCIGDSGSPIFRRHPRKDGFNAWTIFLMHVQGHDCEVNNIGYAKSVIMYLPWIQNVLYLSKNPFPGECGRKTSDHLDADSVHYATFPFVVSVNILFKPICGGSILTHQWVLTSGSCVIFAENIWLANELSKNENLSEVITEDTDPSRLKKLFSLKVMYRSMDENENATTIFVEKSVKIQFHPNFNQGYRPHDIALLEVENLIIFTVWAQPICLPSFDRVDPDIADQLMTVGWMRNSEIEFADLMVIDCGNYPTPEKICLEENREGNFKQSLGAPVFKAVHQDNKYVWTLVGVLSFSFHMIPVRTEIIIASRVDSYMKWITEKIYGKEFSEGPCAETLSSSHTPEEVFDVVYEVDPSSRGFIFAIIDESTGELTHGAILAPSWILTVAHFFIRAQKKNVILHFGVGNFFEQKQHIEMNILSIQIHPKFDRLNKNHDLAMLKTVYPVLYGDRVKSICLAPKEFVDLSNSNYPFLRILGWGFSNGSFSNNLTESFMYSQPGLCKTEVPVHVLPNKAYCYSSTRPHSQEFIPHPYFIGGSGGLAFDSVQHNYEPLKIGWTLFGIISQVRIQDGSFGIPITVTDVITQSNRIWIEEVLEDISENSGLCGQTYHNHTWDDDDDGEAATGSFPFVVIIRYLESVVGAGTIVDGNWILTSAHIIEKNKNDPVHMDILAGVHNITNWQEEGVRYWIEEVFIHPKFQSTNRRNDIALLKVNTLMSFYENIQPACLLLKPLKLHPFESLYLAGWQISKNNISSDVMQRSIVNLFTCKDCFGRLEGVSRSCVEENDGPLFMKTKDYYYSGTVSWYVAGIVSHLSHPCKIGESATDITIVKVSFYKPWIDSVINNITDDFECGRGYDKAPDVTDPKHFPFTAHLQKSDGSGCSGTILKHYWILTSAGCVMNSTLDEVTLFFGGYDAVERHITGIYIHPTFNTNDYSDDIALLKLADPLSFSSFIQPMCLPSTNEITTKAVYSIWETRLQKDNRKPEVIFYLVKVMKRNSCEEEEDGNGEKSSKTYCITFFNASIPCKEIGAALLAANSDVWTLAGIVSSKKPSCRNESGEISTTVVNVAEYLKWIERVEKLDGMKENPFPGLCGQSLFYDTTPYILNGNESPKAKYPFLAYLSTREHKCGGALLNSRWIISSASCVLFQIQKTIRVYLGMHDARYTEEGEAEPRIKEIYIKRQHDKNNQSNDLALIKLMNQIQMNGRIQPICLPDRSMWNFSVGDSATVAGWGYAYERKESAVLRETTMTYLRWKDCQQFSQNKSRSTFCVASVLNTSSCLVDYGGPVFQYQKLGNQTSISGLLLIGILTVNLNTCQPSPAPLLATKVLPYLQWINRKIKSDDAHYCGQSYVNEDESSIDTIKTTRPNSFPFIALIHDSDSFVGGTIFSQWWILTSADFFPFAKRNETFISLGVHDMNAIEPGAYRNFIRHVFLQNSTKPIDPTDRIVVALVRTVKPIVFTESVQPVCLPINSYVIPGEYLYVAGWDNSLNVTMKRKEMQQVQLLYHKCPDEIPTNRRGNSFFCLKSKNADALPCNFRGSPIFIRKQWKRNPIVFGWTMIGMLSFYKGNCPIVNETLPVLLGTNITVDLNWLRELMHADIDFPATCGLQFFNESKQEKELAVPAIPGSFPFIVSVVINGKPLCTGTLLEHGWVLTVASCFSEKNINYLNPLQSITVALGLYDLKTVQTKHLVDIVNLYVFDKYEYYGKQYNLALLKIQDIVRNDFVQPICFDPDLKNESEDYYISGWGKINYTKSDVLLQQKLKNFSPKAFEGSVFRLVNYSTDTCITNAGAPIFKKANSRDDPRMAGWTLIGVLALENDRCRVAAFLNVTGLNYFPWLKATMHGEIAREGNCGISFAGLKPPLKKYIHGGIQAVPGSWPWAVLLRVKGLGPKCGGSIISKNFVATAATCTSKLKADDITIFAGMHDTEIVGKGSVVMAVKFIRIHPRFRSPHYDYNIALLRTKGDFEFTKTIQPICLPVQSFPIYKQEEVYIAGWGKFTRLSNNSNSGVLREAELTIVPWSTCQQMFKNVFQLSVVNICAEDFFNEACENDEGGPMAVKVRINDTLRYSVLYGIISRHSLECGLLDGPVIGLKVQAVIKWVNQIVN